MRGLLIAVDFLVVDGAWALGVRASVVVAHGLSCSAACGVFPAQGSNPCPLRWQADSKPLCHQESPDGSWLLIDLLIWVDESEEHTLEVFLREKEKDCATLTWFYLHHGNMVGGKLKILNYWKVRNLHLGCRIGITHSNQLGKTGFPIF